ncbi:uncharacterized protein si:ch211-191i18.2 [Takifugu flavidus]|uniref:uncharacterized protein si:ch211-191i18.2 n=1 Tax=Takifugu flavidus TaxID=433684 RepID=UPI002544C279|nr:uncharacterized protein si:ch211-191i18.2 [Takifugu flavidus]
MSSLTFLSVYLSGISLFLQLTAGFQLQSEDVTPTPDYDSDYKATFDYSFFSNASSEDLDKFSEQFEDITVTMATVTTPETTERGRINVHNAAPHPEFLEVQTLLWTLLVLITQQLQHTL